MSTVMLDLDGVLNPFIDTFHPWCEKQLGRVLDDPISEWYFYRKWDITDEQFVELLNAFGEAGGFAEQPPYAGSEELITEMINAGHTVHIVTDRPDCAVADTCWWVETYLPGYTSLTISRDKTVFKDYGPPTYYGLDDRVENVEKLRTAGVYGYLLTRPWNAESNLPRVETLEEFKRIVLRQR